MLQPQAEESEVETLRKHIAELSHIAQGAQALQASSDQEPGFALERNKFQTSLDPMEPAWSSKHVASSPYGGKGGKGKTKSSAQIAEEIMG